MRWLNYKPIYAASALAFLMVSFMPRTAWAQDQLSSGDTAWMLTSSVLVLFMTIPAVACGGQVSPYINSRVDGEKMKAFLSLIFILVGGLLIWRGVGG